MRINTYRWLGFSISLFLISIPSYSIQTLSQNFLEKLGFNKDEKLLIIHADDLGMCHSVNQASFEALRRGVVSSGSVLTHSPWASEVAVFSKENPTIDLGIHANFISEWAVTRWRPLSVADSVKSLVDALGFLWSSPEEVATHVDASEFEKETAAQVEQGLKLGLKPSHLDTHSALVFLRPDLMEAYVKIAKKYKLVPLLPRLTPENEAFMKAMGLPFDELKSKLSEYQTNDVSLVTFVHMDTETKAPKLRAEAYRQVFAQLKPGISVIFTELGRESDELNAMTSSLAAGNGNMEPMFSDWKFFLDPKLKKDLQKMKIRLITWRDLQVKSGLIEEKSPASAL